MFGDGEQEQRRLESQAELFDPLTSARLRPPAWLSGCGCSIGSGAGDVAMLAARLVGSDGEVVGVERDPAAIASANARVREGGFANVRLSRGTRRGWTPSPVRLTLSLAGLCSCISLTRQPRSNAPRSLYGLAGFCASRRAIWHMSGRTR